MIKVTWKGDNPLSVTARVHLWHCDAANDKAIRGGYPTRGGKVKKLMQGNGRALRHPPSTFAAVAKQITVPLFCNLLKGNYLTGSELEVDLQVSLVILSALWFCGNVTQSLHHVEALRRFEIRVNHTPTPKHRSIDSIPDVVKN